MRWLRVSAWLLSCVGLHGQATIAEQLRAQRSALPSGSPEWCETGFDLVEAQLAHDVGAAVVTARELDEVIAAARPASPEHAAVAKALLRLARALHEGPAAAIGDDPHQAVDAVDVEALPAAARARALTARARLAWLVDEPDEFLSVAFAAVDAARQAARADLLCRAGFALHRVLEQEAEALDAPLMREIEVAARAPVSARFAAILALNKHWKVAAGLTGDERRAQLEAVERQAKAVGDLRTRAHVWFDMVLLHANAERTKDTDVAVQTAIELVECLGDRSLHAVAHELAAELALERDDFERATRALERAASIVDGRGLADRSVHQAHLRLRLASQRRDTAAVAAETERLEQMRRAEAARYRAYPAVRERLLHAERVRVELIERAATAEELARQRHRELWYLGLLSAALGLAVVAGLALRSRRRLARLHGELRAQVQRADTEADLRRRLEQRIRATERDHSLSTIAGGIAHDFNNLMVGVIGNADLLRADERDPVRCGQLDAILAAGERCARLCSQLQVYASGPPVTGTPLDLGDLLVGMRPLLEVSGDSVARVLVRDATEPLPVSGDAAQLEQLLLNLVANAKEARARTVRVHGEIVERRGGEGGAEILRGELAAGRYVRIEVADDGEGMPAEVVTRVFDPFFTTRFPGRGLGLAEAYGIVRRHGGAIGVVSEVGRGTSFKIYLPMHGAVRATPAAAATGDASGVPPMTVLVVDDEAHIRDFATTMLQRHGHKVLAVGSLAAVPGALLALARAPRLVALVDLSMPEGDGRDVVATLRGQREAAIVLTSGHAVAHLEEVARQLDADGAIAKPYAVANLERVLDAALARRAALRGGQSLGASA